MLHQKIAQLYILVHKFAALKIYLPQHKFCNKTDKLILHKKYFSRLLLSLTIICNFLTWFRLIFTKVQGRREKLNTKHNWFIYLEYQWQLLIHFNLQLKVPKH